MASVFEQMSGNSPEIIDETDTKKPKGSVFQQVASKSEPEESWGKWGVRTAVQAPLGYAATRNYGLGASLFQFLALGESDLDVEDWHNVRKAYEEKGETFDEEAYEQGRQHMLSLIPTVQNLARMGEEQTGLPLEAKTRLQKGLNFAAGATNLSPKGYGIRGTSTALPRPVLGAAIEGAREVLIEAGIPEPIADVASFAILKKMPEGSPSIGIGKETKPSGMTKRRYENLKEPTEVSSKTIGKIENKVENEFRNLTNKIIEESPINKTHKSLAEDPHFKTNAREAFKEVQKLAEEMPNVLETKGIKKELETLAHKKKSEGITPTEFDKRYGKFLEEYIAETPNKSYTATDLVKQFRKNNEQLGEMFEPGQSFAFNRAKREATLDYNRALAGIIEKEFPGSEFSKLFQESNKRWAEISNSETISNFIDDVFSKEKIDFKHARKFFDKKGMTVPFEKAMGKEGFKKFETLLGDLLSTEKGHRMLKVAQDKGLTDLATKAGAYFIHPKAGALKSGYDLGKMSYKKMLEMLLDKPELTVKWDKGARAFKNGDFKTAAKEMGAIQEAEVQFDKTNKARQEALSKFNEKKKTPRNEEIDITPKKESGLSKPVGKMLYPEASEQQMISSSTKQPKLIEYKPKSDPTPAERNTQIAKRTFNDAVQGKIITPSQKNTLKNTEVSLLQTRNQGQQFHGTNKKIPELSSDIQYNSSTQNIYGAGFYTTDALDIADGYSKSKFSKQPTVYKVTEKTPQKIYDAEQSINEFKKWWEKDRSSGLKYFKEKSPEMKNFDIGKKHADITLDEYLKNSSNELSNILYNENPKSVRELYDKYREFASDEGLLAHDVQETMDQIQRILETNGYEGISHKGGLLTNNPEHKVKIYWKPENLEIQEFSYPKSFKKINKINPENKLHKPKVEEPKPTLETKSKPAPKQKSEKPSLEGPAKKKKPKS